ncbi:MAG: hypothetical protein WD425_03910, partial [Nitrospirales bacterium]
MLPHIAHKSSAGKYPGGCSCWHNPLKQKNDGADALVMILTFPSLTTGMGLGNFKGLFERIATYPRT